MKALIAERALELGFDACRFTTADPPQSAPHFQAWLAARRHGDMDYLRRNALKRVDPKQVLPGAQSIICLAASYEVLNSQDSGFRLASSEVSGPLSVVERPRQPSRYPRSATRV